MKSISNDLIYPDKFSVQKEQCGFNRDHLTI